MLRLSTALLFAALSLVAKAQDYKETVIFLQKDTAHGQNVYIRGGVPDNEDCTPDSEPEDDPCAISIEHLELSINSDTPMRDDNIEGDFYLTWGGKESGQPEDAEGTPAQWTTSDSRSDYYSDLNTYGEGYWMVQVNMSCSALGEDGLFEIKGFLDGEWEGLVFPKKCSGDGAVKAPFETQDHVGRCGYINVFEWNKPDCHIVSFPEK